MMKPADTSPTTPTPDLTASERVLIQGIYDVIHSGRMPTNAPSFTSRLMAGAVTITSGQAIKEHELSPLLDRMGVHCEGKGPGRYQRSMGMLLKELPAWVRYAHETPAALSLSL